MRHLMRGIAVTLGLGLALAAAAAAPAAAPAGAANSGAATSGAANAGTGADLAASVDASGPGQLIQTAASAMLKDLDAHRAEYRADPGKVHALVDQVLLPHFDTDYSARLVLGHHWTSASDDQRQRFIKAFYKSLLNNYGDALVDFTGRQAQGVSVHRRCECALRDGAHPGAKNDGSLVAVNYSLRQHRSGLEGMGRGDRGHQLRQELPRRLRRRDRPEGAR